MQDQSQNRKPDFKTAQRPRPHATTRCVLEDGETTPDDLTLGWKGLKRASNQAAELDLMSWGMLGLVQLEAWPMKGLLQKETAVSMHVWKSGMTTLESSPFPARVLEIYILNSQREN